MKLVASMYYEACKRILILEKQELGRMTHGVLRGNHCASVSSFWEGRERRKGETCINFLVLI